MKAFRLMSTSGVLGYGCPEASLRAGLESGPDMIGVDGGSVDPGPHYLGGQTILLDMGRIVHDERQGWAIAAVCKSKNVGPFELTIDVVFDDLALVRERQAHGRARSRAVHPAIRGARRGCAVHRLRRCARVQGDIAAPRPAGDIGDTDVYGAQQHAPPLDVEIPL